MIEIKFFTDGEKYYMNNEHGITKEVDLSAIGSGGGGGSGGVPFIVECEVVVDTEHNATTYTLNKTWKEIHDAFLNGLVIVNEDEGYYSNVLMCYEAEGPFYGVMYPAQLGNRFLETNSEQGYPTFLAT